MAASPGGSSSHDVVLSVERARAQILAPLRPTGPEIVSVGEAWGRVLAAPVVARLTQPPADLSAMDGYAVRAAEAPAGASLRIAGHAPAGRPFAGTLPAGEAVRLFTGSVVPDGADSVVLQEDAEAGPDRVTLRAAAVRGQHIREHGQDFAQGETVLAAGVKLGAREVGLAAAANHPWLRVHRRPVVAILATGDEIAMPGEKIGPGGIVSSNSAMLAAIVSAAGGVPRLLPVAGDTVQAISDGAGYARGADLLVTSGGASVGDHDVIQAGLGKSGFALDFWKIAMRPGKPMLAGHIGDLPVLGLPGNPVSAFVCATLFLIPAIARLAGLADLPWPLEQARLGEALRGNDHRADHMRADLARAADGAWVATAFLRQDSAMLSVLARAGCLILRPPHAPPAEAGESVPIIRLESL